MSLRAGAWIPTLSAAFAALMTTSGCASLLPERDVDHRVSPSPAAPWTPPPEGRVPPPPPRSVPPIPPEYLKPGATVSLEQVVDIALRNNPATRTAWASARAAAANLGSKRSEFFPTLELDANVTRQKQTAVGGQFVFLQTTYGPAVNLNWLLLDLGGRAADVAEARNALFEADWTHDAVIQNLVLQVETAYYAYQNAKAQAAAAETSLKQVQESLAAADERHRAGVSTIADVLQARTAVSQAELVLETAQGSIQTLRGALATAAGVSPHIAVDVAELPENVDFEQTQEAVDALIDRAQSQRPDLAAARFEVARTQSHIRSVRSEGLPTLAVAGSVSRLYFYNSPGRQPADNYSGAVLFRFPVFTGGKNVYDTLQAVEEARVAEGQAETLNDQVVLQVWTSYYNLKTAARRVKTARDLLTSATQSQEVAAGRYRAGVGSILDLLVAQSAYANARAQEAQSRSDWFVALAQLAHDTGSLAPPLAPPSGGSGAVGAIGGTK
jgi:outer membrane protein